jgi:hypothetical protein
VIAPVQYPYPVDRGLFVLPILSAALEVTGLSELIDLYAELDAAVESCEFTPA